MLPARLFRGTSIFRAVELSGQAVVAALVLVEVTAVAISCRGSSRPRAGGGGRSRSWGSLSW